MSPVKIEGIADFLRLHSRKALSMLGSILGHHDVCGKSPISKSSILTRLDLSAPFNIMRNLSGEHEGLRTEEFVHSRFTNIQDENGNETLIRDSFSSINQKQRDYKLLWVFEGIVDLVLHGHGVEVFAGGQKILDLFFEADVPLKTRFLHEIENSQNLTNTLKNISPELHNNIIVVEITSERAEVLTKIKSSNFTFTDRGLLVSPQPWSRFSYTVGLNYMFRPATKSTGKKHLVVMFTAMDLPGKFSYNYKASIDLIGTNALYILDDFGDQGAYYLMDHGDTAIFDSVQKLIEKTISYLGVERENVIMAGSSKGGTAAILHGIGANAGHVFAGAPQTRIGTFVSLAHPNILNFMIGATNESAVDYLNSYLYNHLEKTSHSAHIHIVVGKADHHYKGHVEPFASHAHLLGKSINVELLQGIPHSELGQAFKPRVVKYIVDLIDAAQPSRTP